MTQILAPNWEVIRAYYEEFLEKLAGYEIDIRGGMGRDWLEIHACKQIQHLN